MTFATLNFMVSLPALKIFAVCMAGLMPPVDFLAQVDFFTPKVFRSLGSCATRPSALSRQDGLKHARCPNASAFGFPRLLKLLWLKSPFARKPPESIFRE
jgi:hypothetical protein